MDGVFSVHDVLAQQGTPEGPLGNVWRFVGPPCDSEHRRAVYRAIALARPTARLALCTRAERAACVYLRAAWATMLWDDASLFACYAPPGLHPPRWILPACTWCGTPTGGWCDTCTPADGEPAKAICSECGGCDGYSTDARCRDCHIAYVARAARLSIARQPIAVENQYGGPFRR